MSTARDLANFLGAVTAADLPPQALDHAAMLVASTIASAAMGSGIESSRIIKDMARSLGGSARASVWFDAGSDGGVKLPVVAAAQINAVMSDAAASDDSDLRTIVHCGTPLVAAALAAAGNRSFRAGRSRFLWRTGPPHPCGRAFLSWCRRRSRH